MISIRHFCTLLLLSTSSLHAATITSTPPTNATTGAPYEYIVNTDFPISDTLSFSLENAPTGMTILPKTGKLTWTPAPGQTSSDAAAIRIKVINQDTSEATQNLSLNVNIQSRSYNGYFVANDGNTNNDGTPELPFPTIKEACAEAQPGDTIYVRGGTYTNPDYGNGGKNNSSMPAITCEGSSTQYITIKPYENEKVKFAFDSFNGIRLKGNYINFEGFEVEGPAQKISYQEAIEDWWTGSKIYNGNGIVINGHHINVKNNIVHDTTGSAIFINDGGDYTNITDNIIYNAAWWSTKGTTAIGMISAASSDSSTTQNIQAKRNLVFASESRIFSRVPTKGFSELAIDEGSGSLIQVNSGNYKGEYLIKDSFYLYNGKGIAIARTNNVKLANNTLYMNGSTINGKSTGLRLNGGSNVTFSKNAVVVSAEDNAYSVANEGVDSFVSSVGNYMVGGDDALALPAGNTKVSAIFTAPQSLDFSLLNGIPADVGAPISVLNDLKAKTEEYGIKIAPTNWQMNYIAQTKAIAEAAPDGSSYDWSHWPEKVIIKLPDGQDFGGHNIFELRIKTPFPAAELLAKSSEFIAKASTWKYLDDGSDQGTAWQANAYDDSSWVSGAAQLGYGENDQVTTVSYGDDSSNKHITTYFRQQFTIQNSEQYEQLQLDLLRDDGAVVYLNGVEILRDNMPTGALTYQTRASSGVSGSAENTFTGHAIPTTALANGVNTLAVELHQATASSSDLSFDLTLSGSRLVEANHDFTTKTNTTTNTSLGSINVFNPNNHTLSYSIPENVPFKIDASGNIQTTELLNTATRYDFTVNVSYDTTTVATAVSVTVTNNLPPVFLGGSGHYAISENASIGTAVGFVKATDPDAEVGDTLQYTLTDDTFQIDTSSGEITVKAAIDRSASIQHQISVNVSDGTSTTDSQQTIYIVPKANADTTGILLEHWTGISGNSVSNLTANPNYPANPTQTSVLTSFVAPSQSYGSYGQRASGYLKVTESAEYTFWIASDDESELRLSTDSDPANMGSPIASVSGWTSSQQWTKYASQKSEPIYLIAGRLYYIEALHKEGSGGDHVAVALQKTGDASQTLISGAQVIPPYVVDSIPPTKPTNLGTDTVNASRLELVWKASNDAIGVVNYKIYRDGALIATVAANVLNYIDNNTTSNTTHNYQVIAVDAFGNTSIAATLVVDTSTTIDSVEQALQTGDASHVLNPKNLIVAALEALQAKKGVPSLLTELYGTNAISYTPGNRTQLIRLDKAVESTLPILTGNKGNTLAMAGTTDTSRYAAFGMSPPELFQDGNSLDYVEPFNRLLAWLLAGQPIDPTVLTENKTIALSFANNDRSDILNWISSAHPTWSVIECNTVSDLVNCYNSADLVMTGWKANNSDAATIKQALTTTMNSGKPVLYMHTWYEAYNDVAHAIADLMRFSLPYGGNFWANDAAIWNNVSAMQEVALDDQGLGSIEVMLQHLRDEDYSFDWTQCDNNNSCNSGSPQDTDFLQGAAKVRDIMTSLDTEKRNIFTEQGLRFEKLLALIGDRFRQDVQYPMDKETTDDNIFMKSLYADNAVYNYRLLNPVQPDMGNFSRSDFNHITPTTRTISLTSKKNFRSTGAYALPGHTFKVTRNDTSDLTVKVFINTLRSGATHLYETGGYKRPKYLQSPYFEIASGETIQLTSPYGGPIQLSFSTNDLPVNVTFENVGEHAYWASSDDDTSFTNKLNSGEFDWAEIVTPGFEVHSTLKKMRASVADTKWGSAQALAAGTQRYMSNFPHILAGFRGPGIEVVPEIHDFATAKGWTIDNLDLVKHMNADQALCGYGCSGNPYDAYWSYDPIGHGDVHELGHGLERSRFMFSGWEGHSQTNPYSYYTKSKYHETTNGDPSCQSLPFETAFNALQNSIGQADVEAFMKSNYWDSSNWSHQFMMTIQMMMTTQKMGKLENGWHLLARLHMHDREFRRADNNDTDWTAKKDSLGFSDYTRTEATGTSNNDYMLMALSTVAELDFRDYLSMWGISYSEKAANQVASYGFQSVPKEFFISAPNGYCKTRQNGDFLAKATLAVDGSHSWPSSSDSDSDGYWDAVDNCPNNANSDQADTNGNGQGDVCDLDADSDGASAESNVPSFSGSNNGDGNGDSTADSTQAHVTSIKDYNNSGWLSYSNNLNGKQSNFVTSAPPINVPSDHHLLYGTSQYDIAVNSGASVLIEVFVSRDTAIQDYFLLGNNNVWTAQNAVVNHSDNKTKLTFSVTEGGNFDRDATANGILQLAPGGVMVKSGIDVYPFNHLFGNVELNTQSTAKTFTIKNTGSRNILMSNATITGNNPADFVINSDNCNAQTLAPNTTCTLSASFQPTSIGSKSAMLTISTDDPDNAKVNIFLRNHESDEEESERRLPPVLSAISIEDAMGTTVSTMKSNTQYTIKWTILGYYDDFTSLLTMFNCSGINDGSCGDNYSDNTRFLSAGPLSTDEPASDGIWSNGGVRSKVFTFSHTYTTPNYLSNTPIVIRFYRKSNKDQFIGNGSLSLIIPGNQAEEYYDTTGRRIKNMISP